MILAIDIGNTNVTLGLMHRGRMKMSLKTSSTQSGAALKKILKAFALRAARRFNIEGVVICSVVPRTLKIVEDRFLKMKMGPVMVVGRDVVVPMPNRYAKPGQVGQDRLVGAFAASRLYGSPAIIIDLGTAITFDVVSAQGAYLGGVIVPGIRLSAESLFKKTALLPLIHFERPRRIIGKTSRESIQSGLYFGYGSMCLGMVDALSKQLSRKARIIMTGGHTKIMKHFFKGRKLHVDEQLVLRGLEMLLSQMK
jgi:type III pantothenate kinase